MGSWLIAKLAGLLGGEQNFLRHVNASCVLVNKRDEDVIVFDIFDSAICNFPLGVALLCFDEHWITLRGRASMVLHETIVDDFRHLGTRSLRQSESPAPT